MHGPPRGGYGQPNGMYQVPPGYAPQGGFAPMQPGMGAPMHPGMGPPGGMYMNGPPQGYPQQGYGPAWGSHGNYRYRKGGFGRLFFSS